MTSKVKRIFVSTDPSNKLYNEVSLVAGTNMTISVSGQEITFTSSGSGGGVPPTRVLTAGTGLTGGGDLSADRTFNVVANADGSIVANANDIQVGVLATDAQHGVRGGGTQHSVATGAANGFMSAADKTKLDGLPSTAPPTTRTITAGAGLTGGGDLSADRTIDVAANADGSIIVNANDIQVGILATDVQHGNRGGGSLHSITSLAGGAGFYPKCNFEATTNPGTGNDNTQGYVVGSSWINTSTDEEFICCDASTGAAVWKSTTAQGAGSGGGSGNTTINFGAFPGATDAYVDITGQTSILAGSIVRAWIRVESSADHSADEHWADPPEIVAGSIIAGTGFRIYGRVKQDNNVTPFLGYPFLYARNSLTLNLRYPQLKIPNLPQAAGLNCYGVWNVSWEWF